MNAYFCRNRLANRLESTLNILEKDWSGMRPRLDEVYWVKTCEEKAYHEQSVERVTSVLGPATSWSCLPVYAKPSVHFRMWALDFHAFLFPPLAWSMLSQRRSAECSSAHDLYPVIVIHMSFMISRRLFLLSFWLFGAKVLGVILTIAWALRFWFI